MQKNWLKGMQATTVANNEHNCADRATMISWWRTIGRTPRGMFSLGQRAKAVVG